MRRLIAFSLFCSLLLPAQVMQQAVVNSKAAAAAPAGITLVTHNFAKGPGGAKGTTNPVVDTSTATLLVCFVADGTILGAFTCSDSKGNSWHALTRSNSATGAACQVQYAWDHGGTPLSVGASHTFSIQGSTASNYPVGIFLTFTNTRTASDPFDKENGGNSGGGGVSSQATGSISPGADNEVVVSAFGFGANTSTVTVDATSALAIVDQVPDDSVNSYSGAAAYKVETTAVAKNAIWALGSGSTQLAACIASFQAAP